MYPTYQNPRLAGALARNWPEWGSGHDRRVIALRKKTIYDGNHLPLVIAQIRRTLTGEVGMQVEAFASRSPNILRSVADTVAVVYRRGCRRSLRGVGEAAAKAFATIVTESGIVERGNGINASSWVLGPVTLAPYIDPRNRLAIDIVTPDLVELRRSGKYVDAMLMRHGNGYIELDDSAYRYYDAAGELYLEKPHGAGVCPAVPFISMDNTSNWWTPTETLGLVDVTLNVAYSLALGKWIRQVSGNNMTVVQGELGDVPGGQSIGDHSNVVFTNAKPADADIKVLSRVVPARDRLEEIAADIAMAISQYGIPPGSISMTNGQADWGQLAIKVEGDRLGQLRDKQVPFLLAAEREFWPLVCDFVNASSHKLAGKLPKGDEVREALRVDFPDLASAVDLKARIEAMAAGVPFGVANPREFLASSRPERTEAEIEEEMHENIQTYVDVIHPLMAHNVPAEPDAKGYQTLAQKQGAVGGVASRESRVAVADAA